MSDLIPLVHTPSLQKYLFSQYRNSTFRTTDSSLFNILGLMSLPILTPLLEIQAPGTEQTSNGVF